ncbi:MAG: 1-phosphofructokinase [Treponema sp.]|nr:1-phosphofructokinase [Treponema sp.]
MIYTVTVNPSLDYIVDVPQFATGVVNRSRKEVINAGGKGINVSIVLKNLGVPNRALGFVAGFTGSEIESRLVARGVETDFIHLAAGVSRINVKLRSEMETEINGEGPDVTDTDIQALYKKLAVLNADDMLVLAGSIPAALPQTFYSDIMARLEKNGVLFVVDAAGDVLKKSVEYHPFLVKPNNYELGDIFGVELTTRAAVIPYACELRRRGARNVLVSVGEAGAVLAAADGRVYQGAAPKGILVNSVGAGDSMVAGFIAGYAGNKSYREGLRMGLCAGTASACSAELATRDRVAELLAAYTGDEE